MATLLAFFGRLETLDLALTKRQKEARVVYDCSSLRDPDDLLGMWIDPFNLPPYYGRNWDALDECLSDLSWIKQDVFFVLANSQHLKSLGQRHFRMVIHILSALGDDSPNAGRINLLREVCVQAPTDYMLEMMPEMPEAIVLQARGLL